MLERLETKQNTARNSSLNTSHSREQLNKQVSPNPETQNYSNEMESTVNGLSRTEGRHVVHMHQTEK